MYFNNAFKRSICCFCTYKSCFARSDLFVLLWSTFISLTCDSSFEQVSIHCIKTSHSPSVWVNHKLKSLICYPNYLRKFLNKCDECECECNVTLPPHNKSAWQLLSAHEVCRLCHVGMLVRRSRSHK